MVGALLRTIRLTLSGLVIAAVAASPVVAEEPMPGALSDVDVAENLGKRLNPNLPFTNHEGETVRLGEFF